MKINLFKSSIIFLLLSACLNLSVKAIAKPKQELEAAEEKIEIETIAEDDLATAGGIRWGGEKWPYSKLIEIQDSLVSSPVGRAIVDRHGIDKSDGSFLFKQPFSGIQPGKSVFVSLWGSKIEGCFVEMIVQVAPKKSIKPEDIAPKLLELGINGQIVQLTPQSDSIQVSSYNYQYEQQNGERRIKKSDTWHMARQIFAVDADTANILSNAPDQELKMRINFAKNSLIIPVGQDTVYYWRDAYSFNPTCTNPNNQPTANEREVMSN